MQKEAFRLQTRPLPFEYVSAPSANERASFRIRRGFLLQTGSFLLHTKVSRTHPSWTSTERGSPVVRQRVNNDGNNGTRLANSHQFFVDNRKATPRILCHVGRCY